MSDTPRTDAVEENWHPCLPQIIWDHARELERENAALRSAIAESEEFARKQGESATAKVQELLAENAALMEEVVVANGHLDKQMRMIAVLREDKARLDSGTIALTADGGRRCVWYGHDLRAAIDDALSLRQSRDHLPHGGLPETTGGDRTADGKEAKP